MTETPHPVPGTSGDSTDEQFTTPPAGHPRSTGQHPGTPPQATGGAPLPPPAAGGAPLPPPVYGAAPAPAQPSGPAPEHARPQTGYDQPTAAPPPGYSPGSQQGYAGPQQGYPGPQQGYPGPQQGYSPGSQQSYPGSPQGYSPGAPQGYDPNTAGSYPTNTTPAGSWAAAPQGAAPSRPPYGFPAPAPTGLTIGRALGYGWERLRANMIPWIAITLVGFVAYLAAMVIIRTAGIDSVVPLLLLFLVVAVVVWLLQAAMIRGALYETDGTPPDFQAFFGFVNAGNVLLCALAVFASSLLAMVVMSVVFGLVSAALAAVLGVLAAIVVGFFCMFALHFVIDQDQNPIAAIRSSVRLVLSDIPQMLLLATAILFMTIAALVVCLIGMVVAGMIGMVICALTLLVVGPISVMALTYSYRALTDGLTL